MKKDILVKEDVIRLVENFHSRLRGDNVLGPMFQHHVKDWDLFTHLLCDFWENVVFYSGAYAGNPMDTHLRVHKETPLEIQHFLRWNMLFNETVDSLFTGANAELVKHRAQSISAIIQLKLIKS